MQNCTMTVKGNELTIKVDLSKKGAPSKSGKSTVIGSTSGNAICPTKPNVRVGLNVFELIEA